MQITMASLVSSPSFDFRNALTSNRVRGLWRMLTGYRPAYLAATASLAISATAKTTTFLLLRYFVDQVLGNKVYLIPDSLSLTLAVIGLGFLGLAVVEGTFSFFSGRLAAFTAESITRRLRNYLFDHIQHLSFHYHSQTTTGELIQRSTSDVDAVRRRDDTIRWEGLVIVSGSASPTAHLTPKRSQMSVTSAKSETRAR